MKSSKHRKQAMAAATALARLRSEQPDEYIDRLLQDLKIYAFAVVKEIAAVRKQLLGQMECPLCGQVLNFSIAPSNGHLAVRCLRAGCLHMME